MSMAIVAGGAVVAGAGMQYAGSQRSATAAGRAAEAQGAAAGDHLTRLQGAANTMRDNTGALAAASPQELGILSRSYDEASASLDRENKLMSSIDPALMEASKQALSILRGEGSGNQGMMMQRNAQRQQMVNSLRAQYGPGAEQTSIGQKMLGQFDMETQSLQQNALGGLFSMATSGAARGNQQNALAGLMNVGQGYSAIRNRQLQAETNSGNAMINALNGTGQQMINAAGAGFVQDGLMGQGMSSFGGNLANAGTNLASSYAIGNMMKAPSQAPKIQGGQVNGYQVDTSQAIPMTGNPGGRGGYTG